MATMKKQTPKVTGKATSIAKQKARLDGWTNILTGMGIKGRDRRMNSKVEWQYMTEDEADELYAGSDIARKVVEGIVDEGFREGYDLKADEIDPDLIKKLRDENQRLQIDEKLAEAAKLARQYGGSAIIPIPRDLKLLAKPMVLGALPQIRSLLVLSRWELPREMIETDIRNPNFGRPRNYRICPRTGASQMNLEVHHSWLCRFDGTYLSRVLYFKNNMWHDSVLNTCQEAIRNYEGALSATSNALEDFSIAVSSMKGLAQALSEDADDVIIKRLQIQQMARSVARTVMIDADNEKFEYQTRNLTGLKDSASLISGRLVVASNMPHTKILGESPEGSNATGNSTTKDWYDTTKAWQVKYLKPRALWLWSVILSAKKSPTKGLIPEGLDMEFKALWQEPESVQAKTRSDMAMADNTYIQSGVLNPKEVALSRFGSGTYSMETKLLDDRASLTGTSKKVVKAATKIKPGDDEEEDPTTAPVPVKNKTKPFKSNKKANNKTQKAEADT